MNKREKASEYLHALKGFFPMREINEALDIAISNLRCPTREQVEQVWGSEWINLPYIELFKNKCSQCGIGSDLESDFCPACGAPMTDKAVDMVVERLEALYERNDD